MDYLIALKEQNTAIVRNKYTTQALQRAGRDAVPTVAKNLRLAESTLYSW